MKTSEFQEIDRFREFSARQFGLQFDDLKLALLRDVLQRRSAENALPVDRYLALLESGDVRHDELRDLARELTVGETYFFRNVEQFHALREVVLAERLRAQSNHRKLRILSAGCASGEEPYSIATVIRDTLPTASGWEVDILAVDVNHAALEKARCARYSSWSLRQASDEIRDRWFREEAHQLVLDESIRRMVRFEEKNLVSDDPALWAAEAYDVVFCRNVVMYLTPENAQVVINRITGSLTPGGFLFLGHAETLRGFSRDYHLRHTHETFYYQRKELTSGVTAADVATSEWFAPPAIPVLVAEFEAAASWPETIARAAERIRVLTQTRSSPAPARPLTPAAGDSSQDLALANELLRKERYVEALALVNALPHDSARDPDVLMLRSVLLAQSGDLAGAESLCGELLTLDELSAGAHYLMALCREGAGDRGNAIDHDQVAIYLDPSFAAPRLHLGLLARKAGDRESARRDLSRALVLLEREDTSRLLLFGGGFSREALIALCRAELIACGGAP